jgi:hypothetical protein
VNTLGHRRGGESHDAAEFCEAHAGILLRFAHDSPTDILQQMFDALLFFLLIHDATDGANPG